MSRRFNFTRPTQPRGRLIPSRFMLRREPEPKAPTPREAPTASTYSEPGRGPNGETSN